MQRFESFQRKALYRYVLLLLLLYTLIFNEVELPEIFATQLTSTSLLRLCWVVQLTLLRFIVLQLRFIVLQLGTIIYFMVEDWYIRVFWLDQESNTGLIKITRGNSKLVSWHNNWAIFSRLCIYGTANSWNKYFLCTGINNYVIIKFFNYG